LGTGYASTLFKKASTPFSGEQIVYTYDALNRLASAQTTSGPTPWGQSYNYDGFGNLVDQNVILGSAPSMSATYNPATNRQYSDSADANGNVLTDSNGDGLAYDGVNRLIGAVAYVYGYRDTFAYDAQNHRVMRTDSSGNQYYAFWGPNGQKLCEYTLGQNGSTYYFAMAHEWVYFGGKLIAKDNTFVVADRLGSMNGKYYPYGQERPSATSVDTEKFTGYFRDSATGLDYANQRYHQPGMGRFMTADPDSGSAQGNDPGSMNRYAYTRGDPVNRVDRSGTDDSGVCDPSNGCGTCDLSDPTCGAGGLGFGDGGYGSDGCAYSQYLCPGYASAIAALWTSCAANNPTVISAFAAGGAYPTAAECSAPETAAPPPPQCPLVGILGSYTLGPGTVYAEFAPTMAYDVDEALATLNSEGITPQINSGYRSSAAQGNIPKNNPFPVAKAGQSWHNVGEAIDIQLNPATQTGQEIIAAMEGAGLTWGGTFSSPDIVHFQLPTAIMYSNGTLHAGAPSAIQVANCQAEHPDGH